MSRPRLGPTSRSARRETAGSCMSRCVSARPLLRGERIGELVTGIEPGLPDAQQLPVTPMHTGRRPGAVLVLVNDQQPYKSLKDFVDDAKKRP